MPDVRALLESVCDHVDTLMPDIEQRRYDITYKPDNSPVTAADVFLEAEIEQLLRSELPDLRFIGEETYDGLAGELNGWVAVLDPIDGTENFCSGLKEWGVSLTIWRDGEHKGS